jgi:DNA-binding transcriptional MerR regulator
MMPLELEQFIDTRSFEAMGNLMETISKERLSSKTLGVSYRTICHWDEKGIIRFSRENAEANRKYSFVDYVWIKVVEELRSFGIELTIIQKIANEIYSPIPIKDIFNMIAESQSTIKNLTASKESEKAEMLEFLKSGEFQEADFSELEKTFNYLHLLVAEIITTKKPVSIIVFKNGDWFPYIKENEHLYSEDLLYKKEYESQVSVSLTNLIFNFMLEENMAEFSREVNLLTLQEINVLNIVVKGDYKKITVLYKSKKNPPTEILNTKNAHQELTKLFRKKNYREFIVTDNQDKEYRIREEKQQLDLSEGVKEIIKGNVE